jgi:hypothetical protein
MPMCNLCGVNSTGNLHTHGVAEIFSHVHHMEFTAKKREVEDILACTVLSMFAAYNLRLCTIHACNVHLTATEVKCHRFMI